jgi:hypothetical protein
MSRMDTITISVKNYRPFEDRDPARISIGPGFTAFIGPNNSGKSSFLKLFYELRNVWTMLSEPTNYRNLLKDQAFGVSLVGVDDPAEILTNLNDRPITIELSLDRAKSQSELGLLRLKTDGRNPQAWRVEFLMPDGGKVTSSNGTDLVYYGNPIDVRPFVEAANLFSKSLYIGPYRNAITEGSGRYFDLGIGTTFIETWNEWKTGRNREQNAAIQKVTDEIARIFGYQRLEINAAEKSTVLQAIIDGKPYRLRELGAGLAQFLIVLGNVAVQKPSFLLIDEPELHLHPTLQADF